MKKIFVSVLLLLCVVLLAFGLVACNDDPTILDDLRNEYGVIVEGGNFDSDCKLVVQSVSAEDSQGREVINAIAEQDYDKSANVYIFNIYVEKDGEKVQPNGKVTVTIPAQVSLNKEYLVFHVKDSGEVEKLTPVVEEGLLKVEVSSFSYFAVVEKASAHEHAYCEWVASNDGRTHERICACGETQSEAHTYDNGVVTTPATHTEEGVMTYTCTVCGATKTEVIAKATEHEYGRWTASNDGRNHEHICACGDVQTEPHQWDNGAVDDTATSIVYTCTVCGTTKTQAAGHVIVIAGGQATFQGKDTVSMTTSEYGNANVYIAQENDVLAVTPQPQAGRTFKYWMSATGAVIPDASFEMLVLTNGYYYAVFEDSEESEYTNRTLIFSGNCEEGDLYMSVNAKNDIKYEIEYRFYGHNCSQYDYFDEEYHSYICENCGYTLKEPHCWDSQTLKKPTHTETGLILHTCCLCGAQYTEEVPATEEHDVDYYDWTIVEESTNGNYGKYTVKCKHCDYTEEYWYLAADITSFVDGKYIHYHSLERGVETHNEYYYNYTNADNQKVHIFATQYQYAYGGGNDNGETYIFMYIDDEDASTLDPVYLSKSYGSYTGEYLWAVYGYVYDVHDWEDFIDNLDVDAGCADVTVISNTMGTRSSALYGWYDRWAKAYNDMRIPTSKAYDSFLESDDWKKTEEGIMLWGTYYDPEIENYDYVGGYESVTYQKGEYTTGSFTYSVDKNSGVCLYDSADGPYRSNSNSFWEIKTIVSPEQYAQMNDKEKAVSYDYQEFLQL